MFALQFKGYGMDLAVEIVSNIRLEVADLFG